MKKLRNSSGKFIETKNPKKLVMRVTEEEKKKIEKFRKDKND